MDRVFIAGYSLGGCTAMALLGGAITETSRNFRPRPTARISLAAPGNSPILPTTCQG